MNNAPSIHDGEFWANLFSDKQCCVGSSWNGQTPDTLILAEFVQMQLMLRKPEQICPLDGGLELRPIFRPWSSSSCSGRLPWWKFSMLSHDTPVAQWPSVNSAGVRRSGDDPGALTAHTD
jgi:hypothetical protein